MLNIHRFAFTLVLFFGFAVGANEILEGRVVGVHEH